MGVSQEQRYAESLKFVRRGNTVHAGHYVDVQTFCGVPLEPFKEGYMDLGELKWCDVCRIRVHKRTLTIAT